MKKLLVLICGFLVLGIGCVSGQYLYFTGNGSNNTGFQQGCLERYNIYYNTEGKSTTDANQSALNFKVQFDGSKIIYNSVNLNTDIWTLKTQGYDSNSLIYNLQSNNSVAFRAGIGLGGYILFRPRYFDLAEYSVDFTFLNTGAGDGTSIAFNSKPYFSSSKVVESIIVNQAPCVADNNSPVIEGENYAGGNNVTKIQKHDLQFSINDKNGDTDVPYVFTGGFMEGWTGRKNTWNVNNQIGVDSSTVQVVVVGKNMDGDAVNKNISGSKVECTPKAVKTWRFEDRDYNCKVISGDLFDGEFGIEEEIVIKIDGKDRNSKSASQKSITFNSPKPPQAQWGLTESERNNFSQSADIKLTVTDEWAGVDSGTIKVILSGTSEESSGMRIEFTGTKTCLNEGTCGILGSGGGYNVVFNPKALGYILPNYAEFDVLVTACDLKLCTTNHKITNENIGSFTVAPPCWELQCCGDVDVYINDNGSYVANGSVRSGALIVSGGNNPSVELWESTGSYIFGDFFYTGWVVEINCNVGAPTFTIKKGLPGNNEEGKINSDEGSSDEGNNEEGEENDDELGLHGFDDYEVLDESGIVVQTTGLYLSGDERTTKAVISGNIITLAHYIDTLDVKFISPKSNLGDDIFVTNDISTTGVHFEWTYEYGSEKKGGNGNGDEFTISGFDFKLWLIASKWGSRPENTQSVDNGGESGDVQGHSLSTFDVDVSDIYSGDLGDLGDPLVERYLPCGGEVSCTGLDLDDLPDGLYTYAVVASDLGSNTGGLASREMVDPNAIDVNEELNDSDNVAQGVLVSNSLVPSINMINPKDGSIQTVGEVNFEWTVDKEQYCQGLFGPGIDGFQYEIRKGEEVISSGFTTDRNFKLQLSEGTYSMSMFIVYNGEFKGSLTGSLMEETFTVSKPASGGGGGGGSNKIPHDDCPDGDYSDSYYDGICEGATHGSAVYQCKIDESNYGDERKLAYLYSYINHITTMCPIYEADLDGYLYRDHFAKMISNYAINVLGKKPNLNKTGCDQFEDIADDSAEMKYYMKLACQLNLMGMEPDGQTPKKLFDPYSAVTRAEFGTVFSRLLFGDTYNVKGELKTPDGWYRGHLQALKDYGVMTKIEDPRPSYLELRGRVMIVLMRADHYGLFEGVSPALNGIDALFAKKWEANVF